MGREHNLVEVMRKGQIDCECGNTYFFGSIYPQIKCMKCGKMNPNNGEIVVQEELIETVQEDA